MDTTRRAGHASLVGRLPGVGLGTEDTHGRGAWANEPDRSVFAGLGEVRILRQKAVAGMDGVGGGTAGDVEDEIAAKVRFRGWRGTEAVSFIGFEDVRSGAIGVGIDGNGRNAQLAAGAQNTKGDLATIGDEDFAKHKETGYRVQGSAYSRSLGAGSGERGGMDKSKSPRGGEGLAGR